MATKDLVPGRRGQADLPARRDEWSHPFFGLQQQMNRLFDDFFRGWGAMEPWRGFGELGERMGSWNPTSRWEDADNEYRMIAEVPGLGEKDIEVRISGDTITIQGRKEESFGEKDQSGRSYRSFHESFTVPAGIDREHIQAELRNGVLTLSLPKTEEAKKSSRTIEVKTG